MLEARGLCKSYGDRAVVADVSLDVAAGEIVGLLGPNGAGKSTTVAMLCGLVGAGARRGLRRHRRVAPRLDENAQPAKRRIGLVPQDLSLYEDLGAAANLELFGALYGLGGALLRERVDAALALVGLADRARDKPQTFSGGMKRRLNIAAALRPRPRRADPRRADRRRRSAEPQRHLRQPRDAARRAARRCSTRRTTWRRPSGSATASSSWTTAASSPATRCAGLYKRLPAVETLELEVEGTVDLAALGAATGVTRPTQDGARLHVGVAELGRAAPALLTWLAAHGHGVHRISSGRADLEDVFLSLTGRQLRD